MRTAGQSYTKIDLVTGVATNTKMSDVCMVMLKQTRRQIDLVIGIHSTISNFMSSINIGSN